MIEPTVWGHCTVPDDTAQAPEHDSPADAHGSDPGLGHDELALLRQYFRDEARDTLHRVTRRVSAESGPAISDDGLSELMRAAHTLKGAAGTVSLQTVVELIHQLEERLTQIRDRVLGWSSDVRNRLVDAVDAIGEYIESSPMSDELARLAFAELAGFSDATATQGTMPEGSGGGTVVAIAETDTTRSIVASLRDTNKSGGSPGERHVTEERRRDVLRVDPIRIDSLMNGVGELVVDNSRIERRVQGVREIAQKLRRLQFAFRDQLARMSGVEDDIGDIRYHLHAIERELSHQSSDLTAASTSLLGDAEGLGRTCDQLREGLMQVRMLSARALFQRLGPPLRRFARSTGKRVELTTTGDDTEFDKAVAEQITDPIIQLLRNAVAHGIEPAAQRVQAGKAPHGEIHISARQAGGGVILEVSDDGSGIDPAALRRRFVDSGSWTAQRAQSATDEETLQAIFDPGVSTRSRADQLAGRGVGLDAVRETIARLGGEIRMTSTPGRGTSFTLRLPVTTAISQALLFKLNGQVYAVPNVAFVQARYEIQHECLVNGLVGLRQAKVPVVNLHEVLGAQLGVSCAILVIEYFGKEFAITCDKVVGPRQVVVKQLGMLLSAMPLFTGATISGSGKVQLMLDPAALLRLAFPAQTKGRARTEDWSMGHENPRVLVVDDSPTVRQTARHILEGAGFAVDVAADGAVAWSMMATMDYDLVVTDLEMPRLAGFDLIERIRSHGTLRGMPVVVISSKTTTDAIQRAEGLAVRKFVTKPLTLHKLKAALRTALGPRGRRDMTK